MWELLPGRRGVIGGAAPSGPRVKARAMDHPGHHPCSTLTHAHPAATNTSPCRHPGRARSGRRRSLARTGREMHDGPAESSPPPLPTRSKRFSLAPLSPQKICHSAFPFPGYLHRFPTQQLPPTPSKLPPLSRNITCQPPRAGSSVSPSPAISTISK
jgi:hypothetical protein